MRTKSLLLSLFLGTVVLLASCTKGVNDGASSNTHNGSFSITQEAISTASITISWPASNGSETSSVCVYKDIELQELVQEYKFEGSDRYINKFTVPFLNCNENFYIVVTNSKGEKSYIYDVSLDENISRQVIISQNFDKLCWGYDYVNSACGIRLNSNIENNLKSYSPDNLADSANDCHIVTNAGEEGGYLFQCNSSLLQLFDLKGWSGSVGSVYIRPGYIKLGKASSNGTLKSPDFTALNSDEKITGTLSFRACIYSTSSTDEGGTATASIVKKDGSVLWSANISLSRVSTTPEWQNFEFEVEKLTNDCHFEISTNDQTRQICFDNLKLVRKVEIPKGHIYGYVFDKETNEAIEGVAVSDGFQVVTTNKEGFYSMEPNKHTWYIYYSLPSEYKITIGGNGLPKFHTRFESGVREYNFALSKLKDGKEKKFALFAFADPQVSSDAKLTRFKNEAVPAIKSHVESMGYQCYGITLGDIISNSSGSNTERFRDQMRYAMRYQAIGLPVYQVMGNHDANYYDEVSTLEGKDKSERNIRAQRAFEITNGPINYSFNRGNVHIVGMKDIVYTDAVSMANYQAGFIEEQYNWLVEDLKVVPKTMTVVLCVHIQLHGYRTLNSQNYIGKVHQLLNEFQEAHILSGHTHINRNEEPNSTFKNVYEHNVGTVCGTWWASNVCGDGTPNGYGVFMCEGTGFSEWYYMGYNEGMNDRNYQMRLYRGNAITGAKIDDNKNGVEGYYSFNFGDDVILANVFNADSKWTIKVYEDGVYSGTMKKITNTSASYTKELVGSYTFEDPRRIKSGVEAANDMWVVGFHMGVLDRCSDGSPSNGSWTSNTHMYKYKLKNKNAKVEVIATDRFGNEYKSDKFVDYRDNDLARKPY